MAVTFGAQGLTVRAAGGGGIGPTGPTGPTGATGAIGQGFVIAQVYNSEAERIAATGASLPGDGEFALIAGTLSQSDADYGKLYLWKNGAWVYQTDMSVQGVMGPTGASGTNGATGATGATGASYYDVALFYSGKPTANEVILRHVAARAFNLTATASSHKLLVGTNPAANADIKVSKLSSAGVTTNIMYIRVATNGTITYRDANNSTSLTTLVTTSFAIGDRLLITAPASADSTMADIHVTLTGLAV